MMQAKPVVSAAGQAKAKIVGLANDKKEVTCWTNRLALRGFESELNTETSEREVYKKTADFLKERAGKIASWRRKTIAECNALANKLLPPDATVQPVKRDHTGGNVVLPWEK